MKDFFKVTDLQDVLSLRGRFSKTGTEKIDINGCNSRISAETVVVVSDLPGFSRSVMDGFAVSASSTFGASEGNPAFLNVVGDIPMGKPPGFSIGTGDAARISTGGMLPEGSDSVVMVEHTETIDESAIEVLKSVAPGQHIVEKGEDYKKDEVALKPGTRLRFQETGLLAALGYGMVRVHKKPVVGIISTGDEIVGIDKEPSVGEVRDVNSYSLAAMVHEFGGIPIHYGIVKDNYDDLLSACSTAFDECDIIILSGGSSVGTRDYTTRVIDSLPDSEILVHGISISPGKPTILANVSGKPVWGLPGHIVSAMVVFKIVVKPFMDFISGLSDEKIADHKYSAILSRNISSASGRTDFLRVSLYFEEGKLMAEPVTGKSGLIHTIVQADGLIEIDKNTEGLEKGSLLSVIPL